MRVLRHHSTSINKPTLQSIYYCCCSAEEGCHALQTLGWYTQEGLHPAAIERPPPGFAKGPLKRLRMRYTIQHVRILPSGGAACCDSRNVLCNNYGRDEAYCQAMVLLAVIRKMHCVTISGDEDVRLGDRDQRVEYSYSCTL